MRIVSILSRLHADLIMLKNNSTREVENSRRNLIEKLAKKNHKAIFGLHISKRFSDAISLIKDEKISVADQAKMIDQWQRKFLLLAR